MNEKNYKEKLVWAPMTNGDGGTSLHVPHGILRPSISTSIFLFL